MLIDAGLVNSGEDPSTAAARIEAMGYAGLWAGESNGDVFLQLLLATQGTTQLNLGSSIAIAFSRTPMTTAYASYDLARFSRGRFILGLGSQVKAHVERRFSMPWSHPAARMREYVAALRAIFSCWQDGTKLDFRGDFYTHTLMPPFFAPKPLEWGPPPVYLAGVGELMTQVAGEVGDGFFLHPLTTPRYVRDVTLPALTRGRAAAGHDGLDGFALSLPAFVSVGRNEQELATAIRGTKQQIAFYASTPAYRPVLELHGWGDLQPELTVLTKTGGWKQMSNLIDDEILGAFAVVGGPEDVAAGLLERWGGVVTRMSMYTPYRVAPEILDRLLARLTG